LDIRLEISYPVIIWYPAKKYGIFAGFITEAAAKHASPPSAAVPQRQELHWLL